MKRVLFFLLLICSLGMVTAEAEEGKAFVPSGETTPRETTVVEIDYGPGKEPRKVEIPLVYGKTALAVLESVATVKTRPVGPYVFVISIDDVESRRGETAWYYEVDGKAPGELAYTKMLTGTKHIRWIYKKDLCSAKVDQRPDRSSERGDLSK